MQGFGFRVEDPTMLGVMVPLVLVRVPPAVLQGFGLQVRLSIPASSGFDECAVLVFEGAQVRGLRLS